MNQAQKAADVRGDQIFATGDLFCGKKVRVDSEIDTQIFLIGHMRISAIVEFPAKTGEAGERRSQYPITFELPEIPPAFKAVGDIITRVVAENP